MFVASASPGGSGFSRPITVPDRRGIRYRCTKTGVEIAQSRFFRFERGPLPSLRPRKRILSGLVLRIRFGADTIPALIPQSRPVFLSTFFPFQNCKAYRTIPLYRPNAVDQRIRCIGYQTKCRWATSNIRLYLDTTFGYAGVRIRTNPIQSGYLRINRIATYFEKSKRMAFRWCFGWFRAVLNCARWRSVVKWLRM